jgi:hypothetical protein
MGAVAQIWLAFGAVVESDIGWLAVKVSAKNRA